ncbi:hypothetical protein ACOTTU_19210 [Roseobacter sp. EG26]|uniref:hypothetical protein n=1 Tax=Roseobacter sp. EG26 TaxID=3412477 RepID=UPI003CE5311A
MPLSTADAVRDLFVEATRQSLARSLRTGEDWDQYKNIIRETSQRLEAEQAAHARDYPARIAEAKEIILREEHGIRLDHPLPKGVDTRSSADALQSKAETRVRQDYDQRVAAIKSDELDQYRSLTNTIRMRDAPDQSPSRSIGQSFNRTGPSQS